MAGINQGLARVVGGFQSGRSGSWLLSRKDVAGRPQWMG
jgi:hypothetical protein